MEERENRYDKIVLLLVISGIVIILCVIINAFWWQYTTQTYTHMLSERIEMPDMELDGVYVKYRENECWIHGLDLIDRYEVVDRLIAEIEDFPVTSLISGPRSKVRRRA